MATHVEPAHKDFTLCGAVGDYSSPLMNEANCGVCLMTAEQLVATGLAEFVPAVTAEIEASMTARLSLLRSVSAYAPPGDWWVCPCRPYQPQEPNHFVEVIRLTSGEMRALGASKNRCCVCDEAQGEHHLLGGARQRHAAGYLITGVK